MDNDFTPARAEVIADTLKAKLAAIVVHADELTSPHGHAFDLSALNALVNDAEVVAWVKSLGALAPVKRNAR